MTNYDEAYQMALASNVVVAVGNETSCAGLALTKWATEHESELDEGAKKLVTHIVDHLSRIQTIATMMDNHYDEKLDEFDDSNPGKMIAISRELAENPLIRSMQEAMGMSEEEIDSIKARKLAEQAGMN